MKMTLEDLQHLGMMALTLVMFFILAQQSTEIFFEEIDGIVEERIVACEYEAWEKQDCQEMAEKLNPNDPFFKKYHGLKLTRDAIEAKKMKYITQKTPHCLAIVAQEK